ncbi:hypothetical protein PGTUg99_017365 [Puccinia graminis f. sp. tritici]|uniref:Uncharacterized protein n=1 Tax=Puccinia graminis f. sp. tritici TaxID=56615 RepID=A0A5B0LLI2_PUCGR|nr:hypothetical protein PGTUg99_017365 [Puccinia graminis f. sp. tritici]
MDPRIFLMYGIAWGPLLAKAPTNNQPTQDPIRVILPWDSDESQLPHNRLNSLSVTRFSLPLKSLATHSASPSALNSSTSISIDSLAVPHSLLHRVEPFSSFLVTSS